MNLNEAVGFANGMKNSGWNNMDVAEHYKHDHKTGYTQSDDKTVSLFYFPEGVMILTQHGEVEEYSAVETTVEVLSKEVINHGH